MKIHERYLWIAALLVAILFAQQKTDKVDGLEVLLKTYELESTIQDAQITDFGQQLRAAKDSAYQVGFEEGRTQAATVLANADSLYNYTDGYHAAISQNELLLESAHSDLLDQLEKDIAAMLKRENPSDGEVPEPDPIRVND